MAVTGIRIRENSGIWNLACPRAWISKNNLEKKHVFFLYKSNCFGQLKKQFEGGGHVSQILLPEEEGCRALREREPKIAYVYWGFVSVSQKSLTFTVFFVISWFVPQNRLTFTGVS